MSLTKFSSPSEDDDEPYDYGYVYKRSASANGIAWVEIGASHSQVELLRRLLSFLEEPFRLLYVLLVPRGDGEEGRYATCDECSKVDVEAFLNEFGAAFEQDARHALWVHGSNGQLIFTQHNVIYAYGPVNLYVSELVSRGFHEEDFSIPTPHAHLYHAEFDSYTRGILESREWSHSALMEIDEET